MKELIKSPQEVPANPEKGAIGVAFLVWLFGGGLGLALIVFIFLKMC
ncbi:MAG TPA: hypothetical protein VIU61_04000 [Kofleriaceae bacterium]